MNIDIASIENKNVMWAICHAMNGNDEITKILNNSKTTHPKSYDVVFTVNGVELDFQKMINALVEQYSLQVEKTAKKLLKDRFSSIIDGIDDIQERIEAQKDIFKYDWEVEL
jgi:hypothetical protein